MNEWSQLNKLVEQYKEGFYKIVDRGLATIEKQSDRVGGVARLFTLDAERRAA